MKNPSSEIWRRKWHQKRYVTLFAKYTKADFGWLNDNENALQWREKLYNRLREIMKDRITPEKKEKYPNIYPNIPPEIWVPRVDDFINIITELLEET